MPSKLNHEIFAQKVRERRRALGLTQRELGSKANLSHTSISSYEKGESLPNSVTRMRELAVALGIDFHELYGEELGDIVAASLPPKPPASAPGLPSEVYALNIDFERLQKSFKKNGRFQLKCWQKTLQYLLDASPLLPGANRQSIEDCLDELQRLRNERKHKKSNQKSGAK